MSDLSCKIIDTELSDLLLSVMEYKNGGYRFVQAHAINAVGGYEVFYTFGKDMEWVSIRVKVAEKDEVPSVTNIYPAAFLYENEIKELFGVDIRLIEPDYKDRLYRIKANTPMKKEVKEDGK